MNILSQLLIVLSILYPCSSTPGKYMISCPQYIQAGSDFELEVVILDVDNDQPITLDAKIMRSKTVLTQSPTLTITQADPATSHTLTIPAMDDLEVGSYEINVSGQGGLTITNTTSLTMASKTHSLYIQSDKSVYKPGDLLNYRVFAVDKDLMTYFGTFTIQIIDPNDNIVKQWRNQRSSSGAVIGMFQLIDGATVGEWTIKATAENGVEAMKEFTVKEYVLPKFEVQVSSPAFFYPFTQYLPIKIEAKYTYGKAVAGLCKVEVTSNYDRKTLHTFRLDANGQYTYEANMDDLFERTVCWEDSCSRKEMIQQQGSSLLFNAMASCTEEATAVVINSTVSSTSYKPDMYWIRFPSESNPENFKPGLPYSGYVKVSDNSGNLIDIGNRQLELTATFSCISDDRTDDSTVVISGGLEPAPPAPPALDGCEETKLAFDPPVNGLISFTLDSIPSRATSFSLKAKIFDDMGNTTYDSIFVSKFETVGSNVVGVRVTLESPTSIIVANDQSSASFIFTSSEPVPGFYFKVFSKANVLQNGYEDVGDQTSKVFSIPIQRKMAPSARLLVWLMTADGEIVADSVNFNVDGAFANRVTASFSHDMRKPGESINIQGSADSDSSVFLLAVDKSVLLLGDSHDITQAQVLEELGTYDPNEDNIMPPNAWRRKKRDVMCFFCPPSVVSGSNTGEIIKASGFILFTDGYMKEQMYYWGYPGVFGPVGAEEEDVLFARPEMAQPDIMDGAVEPAAKTPQVTQELRIDFPETWIWQKVQSRSGQWELNDQTVPDTITSWYLSAFALNNNTGLGITDASAMMTVFVPFFVSLNLPPSVVRGEEFILKVTVFNYLDTNQLVTVTLKKSAEYEILLDDDSYALDDVLEEVQVGSNQAQTVIFIVYPTALGRIDITVMADSSQSHDGLKRQLLVKPEGTPQQYSDSMVLILGEGDGSETRNLLPFFADDVVDGSQRIQLTVIGDIMGSALENLDQLVQKPCGCGEQTMIYMAPNVFVMKYLTNTNQGSKDLRDKALGYIDYGYQRELTYKRNDGSISAFGESDSSGSNWLTAFVIRNFKHAEAFIDIDPKVIKMATDWVLTSQGKDGSFRVVGNVIHKEMLGGTSESSVAFTAFIVISLMEEPVSADLVPTITTNMASAQTYLEGNLNAVKEKPYEMAIVTYALVLLGSSKAEEALTALELLATWEGTEKKYWSDSKDTPPTQAPDAKPWLRYDGHTSKKIETTAYSMMAFMKQRNSVVDVIPVLKWLISQSTSVGGYPSTQDTILGLQAQAMFAGIAYGGGDQNLNLEVSMDGETIPFETLTVDNNLVLQSMEIPVEVSEFQIVASGSGIAIVQMSVFWNQMEPDRPDDIVLDVNTSEQNGIVTSEICVTWKNEEENSGMSLVMVRSLSGFVHQTQGLIESYKDVGLKRVEVLGEELNLYFDELRLTPICVRVDQERQNSVLKQKPSLVRASPYYLSGSEQVAYYLPDELEAVDVCQACADCAGCYIPGAGRIGNSANPSRVSLMVFLLALCLTGLLLK